MSNSYKKNNGCYLIAGANNSGNKKKQRKQYNGKWRTHNRMLCAGYRTIQKGDILNGFTWDKNCYNKHDEVITKWQMLQDGDYILIEHHKTLMLLNDTKIEPDIISPKHTKCPLKKKRLSYKEKHYHFAYKK